jgi:hypothetical protein
LMSADDVFGTHRLAGNGAGFNLALGAEVL